MDLISILITLLFLCLNIWLIIVIYKEYKYWKQFCNNWIDNLQLIIVLMSISIIILYSIIKLNIFLIK